MFKPVSSRVSFPEVEESILKFWQENNVFQRSVEARQGGGQRLRRGVRSGAPTPDGAYGRPK